MRIFCGYLKSRPCENSLADFCIFALLKALKINLIYSKKVDGQAFKSKEVQKSAREFSQGLNLNQVLFENINNFAGPHFVGFISPSSAALEHNFVFVLMPMVFHLSLFYLLISSTLMLRTFDNCS